eukprot:CAMPEP_0168608902 /NCGR_PEP_ID=MMETSP0449_2-20121227/901_1 /TAXON_ID=1082188 /ORGANISM="Strombidium rassoulzadegani, Strain ras09" /LENGTH=51 /DNA_ID=CAMNT_0008648971 /DNA_START=47 /DNA_END=202 /DNA_ORIENTATION=+
MRIEGKRQGGKPSSHTIRRENFKNEQALGKKAILKLREQGAKSALKKNFHK